MSIKIKQSVCCCPYYRYYRCLKADVSLFAVSEVVADKEFPAILGANQSVRGQSIFAAEPIEVFEFDLRDTNPFEKLYDFLSKYKFPDQEKSDFPKDLFCGGWVGYFGYELGRFIEILPERAVDDLQFPVIRLGFYDKAILYDHRKEEFALVALEYAGQIQSLDEKFEQLESWLKQAQEVEPLSQCASIDAVEIDRVDCNITKQEYFQSIERIKQYIIDGDTYQINFSQRFKTDFKGKPIHLFHWQNTYNPSPFSAYLAWNNRAVVSASPELFLSVKGDRIMTKPIKGTRPRNPKVPDESSENQACFHALVNSDKEQAELAMIVDLERNDMARICVPGTRHVTCARKIEAFPTVYHALAEVEGLLKTPAGPQRIIDVLMGTFPGGSITGAPKIRSMEIIDELEPTARGVYTGSIGWIGLNYDFCWNIAIRTILIGNQRAYVQTGGGIVADSDPQAEWLETLTKARALLAGLDAVGW